MLDSRVENLKSGVDTVSMEGVGLAAHRPARGRSPSQRQRLCIGKNKQCFCQNYVKRSYNKAFAQSESGFSDAESKSGRGRISFLITGVWQSFGWKMS